MIRKPRDAARVAELAARRAGQLARVAGYVPGKGSPRPKHTKDRSYPSERGNFLREGREILIAGATSDRGKVIARMTGPERKKWNGKGKTRGGARELQWARIQADHLATLRRAA